MTTLPDTNGFAPHYLELLSFRRRRPTSRGRFPPATLVPMPDDVVDCVDLWAEVLRALGWLRVAFRCAEAANPRSIRAVLTPRSRWDHSEEHPLPLSEGTRGLLGYIESQQFSQLHWMRERFLALDAAPSPAYLFRTNASGRRTTSNGLLLLTPTERRAVLDRVGETGAFSFSARVPHSTHVALPFDGISFLAGVLLRVRLEADGCSVVVNVLEVVDHGPTRSTFPTARQAVLHVDAHAARTPTDGG